MTCEDCIHYDVCRNKYNHLYESYSFLDAKDIETICKQFKDKSKYIELPCKVGDTIWFIWLNALTIQEAKVSQILIDESSKSIKVNYNHTWTLFDFEYLDRWWFFTKGEAEAKLKELKK